MTMLKRAVMLLSALAVGACGGGGGDAGKSLYNTGTSTTTTTSSAAKLSLVLSATSLADTGAGSITATATATADGGQVVSGAPVTFTVDNNATFSASGAQTSATGTAVATVNIGADRSNRIINVTATSGSLSTTAAFAVTGATLSGTPVPAIVAPGSTGNRVDFRLIDANAAPIAGQAISVVAGGAAVASGVTGTAGDFSYTYTSPTTIGSFDVVATAGGVSNTQTIQIQAVGASTIPVATGPIQSASVSANPSVVSVNTASTSNRIEIRALFLGANNSPLKNVRVRFDLAGDPSSTGGTFSTGSSVVYSDVNGIATTAYIPGTRSSPTNGVTIRACYGVADFTSCATAPATTTATITVVSDPLAVTVGTNEFVYLGPNDLTYQRRFVVLVVDSSGNAKPNVQIVPSIDIDRYYKGRHIYATATSTTQAGWTNNYSVVLTPGPNPPATSATSPAECFNEDVNRNGVLEAGEDLNHNGSLEPRKSDVAVSILGSTSTDSSGLATVQIEYPRNIATWARIKLLVSATGVSGTEGRATWTEILKAPASAITATTDPAFKLSPYGLAFYSMDGVLYPDTPGATPTSHNGVLPCNNPN